MRGDPNADVAVGGVEERRRWAKEHVVLPMRGAKGERIRWTTPKKIDCGSVF